MSSLLSKTKLSPKDKSIHNWSRKHLPRLIHLKNGQIILHFVKITKVSSIEYRHCKGIILRSIFIPSCQSFGIMSILRPSQWCTSKALSVYEYIFDRLPESTLNKDINIWLPGLLPLSYSSILVKPLQIKMFRHLILSQLSATTLRGISKPFILCLLAGLDDENSEVFGDVIELLDAYKLKLNNDSHFWQSMFVCIIRNPERRLGALHWCKEASPVYQLQRSKRKNSTIRRGSALLKTRTRVANQSNGNID